LNERKVFSLLLLSQTAGIAFYVAVFLTYSLGLPSTDNLIGDPTFRLLLQGFGGLFLILVGSAFAATALAGKKSSRKNS
jgi:hypothetical protein